MGAKLLVSEQGRDQVQVLDMSADEVWVGRSPECALRVDDGLVSRKHAVVRRSQDRYLIEDLLSANGTYINEQRVRGVQALTPDDIVRCGGVVMRLVLDDGNLPPPPGFGFDETISAAPSVIEPEKTPVPAPAPAAEAQPAPVAEAEAAPATAPAPAVVDNKLDVENKRLRARVAELEASLREIEDLRADATHALDSLREDLKRATVERTTAEENLFNARDAVSARERSIARAEAEVARMREDMDRMQKEVLEMTKHKDQGWGQANDLVTEAEHLRQVIKEQQALLDEQKVQLLVAESRRR